MQKRDNPYTPGAGRKPPMLAGRDGDLEDFQALLERLGAGGYERSLIYSWLRGVGKTVLLMELDVLASESGWATTDVQEVGSQPDFRVTFARMATRLLREMSRRHRIKDRAERALGVVKAFSVAVPSGIQLKLDVQAASGVADSGDPEQDLTDLLLEIGEVAQATGAGALFLIDEMHNLDASALAAICIAFQAVSEIVKDSLARRFFGTRLQMATDTEQRYLAAMAAGGSAPYRSAEVACRFGAKDQRGASVHREALIHKGLIWSPRRGQLDFTVPLFAEYLTDNHPLEAFEEGT